MAGREVYSGNPSADCTTTSRTGQNAGGEKKDMPNKRHMQNVFTSVNEIIDVGLALRLWKCLWPCIEKAGARSKGVYNKQSCYNTATTKSRL